MALSGPDEWLVASTVVLEAEGEPHEGQVAVARVIRNRMEARGRSASQVCLQRLQFSCWNHDEKRREALSRLFSTESWAAALLAVVEAFGDDAPDPSHGASHYLNEAATRAGRPDGLLPSWFREDRVTIRIGRHTFLALG